MIEFTGEYIRKSASHSQSVLVQFDGVLLHVWHMSNPFYRLLTSDVFRLPPAITSKNRCIKLPNGDRIETDNLNALMTIQTNHRALTDCPGAIVWPKKHILLLSLCGALVLFGVWTLKYYFHAF